MLALLALVQPLLAADFLQVDAGAPGMAVQVNLIRSTGGLRATDVLTTSCDDITVGPVSAFNRAANPSSPITGAALSTIFFIEPDAPTPQTCTVYLNGAPLTALSSGIDNRFSIVAPASPPVDGGTNDADRTVNNVIVVPASLRSDGGTLVFSSLSVPASKSLFFDASDPLSSTAGNESYLPAFVLVSGTADIQGRINVSGEDGDDSTSARATDGGSGGPGGGGGGVGSNCLFGATAIPGNGFTGGGGFPAGASGCGAFTEGGDGAITGPDLQHGGEGVFTDVSNGAVGYAGGTGGGTGVPWGTGGGGGRCCDAAGDGGYGGGGANGHSDSAYWGAGGGGFGTAGENGVGVVGGARVDYRAGGAGKVSGDSSLVPLAGGGGGAGGDSGSGTGDGGGGGGGGGALLLYADTLRFGSSGNIFARGGDGGTITYGANPGSSTGGAGGAGGGVHLSAHTLTAPAASQLNLNGGAGGREVNGYFSGDGGEGRLRIDGALPPTPSTGPTGARATTFEGPAIASLSDTTLTLTSSGSVYVYVQDYTGTRIATRTVAADGTINLAPYLRAGVNYVSLQDVTTGVLSPAGAVRLTYTPDADGDGHTATRYGGDDCDDTRASVHPGALESCNGADDNCNGAVDEGTSLDGPTWYADTDADTYGDADTSTRACSQPTGYVASNADCDDTDSAVNPGATEVCNEIDDDCDGTVDEDSAADAATWYADTDADGYGDADASLAACAAPEGFVADDSDCDDTTDAVHPSAVEYCNGVDDNCDGTVDEASAADAATWYADTDSDGYGDADAATYACSTPAGFVADNADCDDTSSVVNPGATEVCNGVDDNCDGTVDEDSAADAATWYADEDSDGYGNPESATAACEAPEGYVANDGDCAPRDPGVSPDATEYCDGLDNNCDGVTDGADAADVSLFFVDGDGDGYGTDAETVAACEAPVGFALEDGDCLDTDDRYHPGATEDDCTDPNDYNCDGSVGYADADGDGAAACEECDDANPDVSPSAVESCNGIDDDCDGAVDEAGATGGGVWYTDADGDAYGDPATATEACGPAEGQVSDATDCDDSDASISPAGVEIQNDGIDQDCDGADLTVQDTGATSGLVDEGETFKGGTACGCASTPAGGVGGVGAGAWAVVGLAGAALLRRRR